MESYKQFSFAEILPIVISKYADKKALGFMEEEAITYSQMGTRISAVKAFLTELGIRPDDKVVIYSQNMPNWGIVYFALHCMGVVVVPVLPDFNKHELQNVLHHSEAKAIFVSESLEYKLSETKKDLVETIISIDNFDIIEGKRPNVVFNENTQCSNSFSPNENKLAILLYTSGTTGNSKGVMLSQKNVITNALQADAVQTILEDDRFLSVLPLSHTFENTLGLILPILKGANVHYLRKPPTASVLIPAMQKLKPHLMLTVPLIIEKVYKNKILPEIQKKPITRFLHRFSPTRKLLYRIAGKKLYQTFGGNLKFFGIGGAKLDPVVEQFLVDAKFPYAIGYGLTETSPMLAGSNPSMTRYQAIGPVVQHCELKINNPDPKTGEGEIWGKGPNIMLGYYKNEANTREVMTEDGWFKTGDLGVFDKDGWLSHKGRLKNLIVGANGENIYPEEIESLINNFRHVIESIVVEKKGKLVALVHFNREELELKLKEMKEEFTHKMDEKLEELTKKVDERIDELSAELQYYINARVNKFSRIQLLVVHPDPFQKTATQKIKRYLYH
ncbi:MAG: AMP-binding protein [Bacteroidetes bacterium]|jgi:long-chain acyl-CoA synthetase|nr:AMP-binding protein [Bacteroidota bacterium]MBT6687913.1 AMP-binding protein [Bacteroidota bacterium]MBT7142439.1 AMP-binding protein [Bacteroidota bacterium]MBT7490054.1 AMP-binding protein [Bacteroidota bacterium]